MLHFLKNVRLFQNQPSFGTSSLIFFFPSDYKSIHIRFSGSRRRNKRLKMGFGVSGHTAVPSIGYAISASRSGKMSVPVSPGSYIYSHFKHVSGVPAPEGSRGVSINRLKILDVLIEQLAQIKKRPEPASLDTGLSDAQIDALIDKYQGQIRQAQAAANVMPYKPAPSAPAGALVNLVA
jgi:hypothetical protein